MNQLVNIKYKYGFKLLGRLYCWKDKKLYRMPFNKNFRWYSKKELTLTKIGNQKGYQLSGAFYQYTLLITMTIPIEHIECEFIQTTIIPF